MSLTGKFQKIKRLEDHQRWNNNYVDGINSHVQMIATIDIKLKIPVAGIINQSIYQDKNFNGQS